MLETQPRSLLRLLLVGLLAVALASATRADDRVADQEIEHFLRTAKIVKLEGVISATHFPMVLDLELGGRSLRAAFKYGHVRRPVGRDPSGDRADMVLDSYRHEVAAYRLDRALSLQMVPVAVLRTVHNAEGAVIEWISDTISKEEARGRTDHPPDRDWLVRQTAAMHVFDALIGNRSRDESDQLVTTADWRLRLIDHSQAFGESPELPQNYSVWSASLVPALVERLEALDEQATRSLLSDVLSRAQLDALIARRDQLFR